MREERFPVSTAAKVYKLQEELGFVQKSVAELSEKQWRHAETMERLRMDLLPTDESRITEPRWPKSEIYRAAVGIVLAEAGNGDREESELVPWAVELAIRIQVEMDRQLATWVPDENE